MCCSPPRVGKVLLGEWLDASVILGVVIINALLGFIQEGKAEKALDSIRNMLSAEAMAVREGKTRMIPAEELVPGDVVLLQSGDKIPADIRLCEVKNLRIEEAPLTGESVPVDKIEDAVDQKAQIGDRKSMAYSGTLVVSGRAKGIVVATGADTELGHINQMLSGVKRWRLRCFGRSRNSVRSSPSIILIVCAITFAYGRLFLDIGFVDMFKAVVGVAVSAIPEGLPAIVTITLAIGVQRMARASCHHPSTSRPWKPLDQSRGYVRIRPARLPAMKWWSPPSRPLTLHTKSPGEGYAPRGEILRDGQPVSKDPVLETMARASLLCNESSIHEEGGVWKLTGDPTEGALLPFAAKVGLSAEAERAAFPRTNMIPFESEHKFMATLHDSILFVKGAPDVVINYCSCQELSDGTQAPLDRKFWEQKNEEIASEGQRVLALACLKNGSINEANLIPKALPESSLSLALSGLSIHLAMKP